MTLTPRDSKLAAIGLLVMGLALGYLLVAQPLMSFYSSRNERIVPLAARAARLTAQTQTAPELKARLARLESQPGSIAPFWPGATDAVAAAGLQERVKSLLDQEGAVVESIEVMPPTADANLHKISLKVTFAGEIDQVERVVHGVEAMSPALMIDHLTIRNLEVPQASAPPLSVELQVFGLASGAPAERPSS